MKRSTRAAKRKVLETVDEEELQEDMQTQNGNSDDGLSGEQIEPYQPETLVRKKRKRVANELKLKMPEYKGKKGSDPAVHVQAFENWAEVRGLPKAEWRVCFPQTLLGTTQKWYFNYPPENLSA